MGMLLHRHNTTSNNIQPLVQAKELAPKVEEKEEVKVYGKTEINRMSTSDLQALAKENGVAKADKLSGANLKKILIDKLVK